MNNSNRNNDDNNILDTVSSKICLNKYKFRLKNITQITPQGVIELDIKQGLAIEEDVSSYNSSEPNYIVVCFIKYDDHEKSACVEDVDLRTIDYVSQEEYPVYSDLVRIGVSLVNLENR